MLTIYVVGCLVNIVARSGCLSCMDAIPAELSIVSAKKSFKMSFRSLFTKMHETVRNMNSALDTVQRPERDVHDGAVWAFTSKIKCMRKMMGIPCA